MPPTVNQCIAITMSRKQCRNNATSKGSKIYCTVHWNHRGDTIHHKQKTTYSDSNAIQLEKNESISCPECDGKGQKNFISITSSKGKEIKLINCKDCDGNGTMSKSVYDKYQFQKNMWCKCSPEEDNPAIRHNQQIWMWCVPNEHWHCIDCKKIVHIES